MKEFEELFYQNPYIKTFRSKVISCKEDQKGYAVVLEDTAFYPEGGGQPFDTGTLNGIKVKEVKRVNGQVVHYTDSFLKEGEEVYGEIDWNRRFDHMVQHTAEHIVSGLIHQKFGYENIGFHMGEEVTLIDFDGPMNSKDALEIEQQANEIISLNLPVLVSYPCKEELEHLSYRSKKELDGTIRLVTIENCDCCACCGTHVAHTGEINLVQIWSVTTKGKGARLEIFAGKRALVALTKVVQQNQAISHQLSAKPFETSLAVTRLQEENRKEKEARHQLAERYASLLADSYPQGNQPITVWLEGMEGNVMRKLAHLLVEKEKTDTVFLFSKEKESYRYLFYSKRVPLRDFGKKCNEALQGRGGGDNEMIQGTFHSDKGKIEITVKEYFDSLV